MFAKIQKLLHKGHTVPSLNSELVKIEFDNLQHAKDFVGKLLKIGFGNRSMPDAPKKIELKLADLENPQDRYIVELTKDEWNALQQDEQSSLEEKQHTVPASKNLATYSLFAKPAPKVDERLEGISFDRLTELIEESRKRVEPAKNRDLILLVGRTGAGKSTTLNYLMGSRMLIDESGLDPRLDVAEGETVYAEIGHSQDSVDSKTLHPQVVPMREFPQDLAYCDCPGFEDNRGGERKLCSSVGLPMAIKYARAILGIIVVIDCADLIAVKGEGLVKLINTLRGLLKLETLTSVPEGNSPSNIFYVFTKVPEGKKISQIIGAIENKKKTLIKNVDELKNRIIQLIQAEISAALLGTNSREEDSREKNSREKEKDLISKQCEDLEIQLKIYNSISANPKNLFIVRGDEHDDKPKIIQHLKQLHVPIPKEQFVPEEAEYKKRENAWNLLDTIIEAIAKEGSWLLSEQKYYSSEFDTLKKYKKLVEKQRANQEEILQSLKSPKKISQNALKKLCENVLNMDEGLTQFFNKTEKEKEVQRNHLESELTDLNTEEPVRYNHRSLGPVHFQMNTKLFKASLGISAVLTFPMTVIFSPIIIPLLLGSVVGAGSAKLLQKAGLKVSDETINKILIKPFAACVLALGITGVKSLTVSHRFQYKALPFIKVEKKSEPQFRFSNGASDTFGEILEEMSPISLTLGFDSSTEIIDKDKGIYEITYRNMHGENDYNGPLTVWIELFVKKKELFKSRIENIKKELEQLRLLEVSYLKTDLGQLAKIQEEERSLIKGISKKKELRSKLCEILEKRLSQHKKRMEILRGCILGYQAHVRKRRRELIKQKPRYDMLRQLVEVVDTSSPMVKDFISKYILYFEQIDTTLLTAPVWGRKQKPDQQPEYEIKKVTVQPGTSIISFFKRCDKPASFWLGKLGFGLLSSAEAPQLAPFSRVRRGSALESVKEKIAADLYDYLSDGQYLVPKTRLAELPVEN